MLFLQIGGLSLLRGSLDYPHIGHQDVLKRFCGESRTENVGSNQRKFCGEKVEPSNCFQDFVGFLC